MACAPPGATETDGAIVRTYYLGRRKRWRGLVMVAAALGVGAFLVYRNPGFDSGSIRDVLLLVVTFGVFFAVAAQGIERFFTPQPSLIVRRDGLVLLPRQRPDALLPWQDIVSIDVYRFGKRVRSPRFFSIVVDHHSKISRNLPPIQRMAFWVDRTYVGEARYFRAGSDFEEPVDQVVAELRAFREKLG